MSDYPAIRKAATEIAYDNGGINRYRTERQMHASLDRFLASQPDASLRAIDTWLAGLPEEDFMTVCCGEQTEAEALMANAPPFADQLLNDIFEDV